jgi:YHS domain-containing protein
MKYAAIILIAVVLVVGSALYINGVFSSTSPVEDMVECPVMGRRIYPSKAYSKTEYKGKTYYFCCASCPGAFEKDPEKYVK